MIQHKRQWKRIDSNQTYFYSRPCYDWEKIANLSMSAKVKNMLMKINTFNSDSNAECIVHCSLQKKVTKCQSHMHHWLETSKIVATKVASLRIANLAQCPHMKCYMMQKLNEMKSNLGNLVLRHDEKFAFDQSTLLLEPQWKENRLILPLHISKAT